MRTSAEQSTPWSMVAFTQLARVFDTRVQLLSESVQQQEEGPVNVSDAGRAGSTVPASRATCRMAKRRPNHVANFLEGCINTEADQTITKNEQINVLGTQ